VLTKTHGKWEGYSYAWNDEQTDAVLVGKEGSAREYKVRDKHGMASKQAWAFPSRTDCMVCHSRAFNFVLGLSELQLNKDHDYGNGLVDNQLRVMEHLGLFSVKWVDHERTAMLREQRAEGLTDAEVWERLGQMYTLPQPLQTSALLPRAPERMAHLVNPYDESKDATARVRSYLHSNCAHCHVWAGGGNATMDLDFRTRRTDQMKVVGAVPLHDHFGKQNARLVAPGNAEQSVLLHRLSIREPGQMPPLGSSAVDEKALGLLREWIAGLPNIQAQPKEPLSVRGSETGGSPKPNWDLIWADEFDVEGAAPDPKRWSHNIGGEGWGNQELEYYTASTTNSVQRKGQLAITATTEGASQYKCWYGPCKYTSARLVTQGRFEVQYGRIEARIQVPRGKGIWPAFWMLGSDLGRVTWPDCGEIDIMEYIGSEPNVVHGTLHGPGYAADGALTSAYTLKDGKSLADDFHVYAAEWNEQGVKFYIDDHLYAMQTPAALPKGKRWAYDHPFFLILNVAVGGAWPGSPDATTQFPQQMLVDYVRVYKERAVRTN
jgi:beta-glucanase (GH16 family)